MANAATPSTPKAWIITGPTSGFGYRTAIELAKHGTVVLVGRDPAKLAAVKAEIETKHAGHAISVVADFADLASVRRAAAEIAALDLPIAGLLNNAGIFPQSISRSKDGFDLAYATNHLGPFTFTEALIPHLPDGAHVVFIVSAVEDPARKPAVAAGFRGARYISAEASSRGEWLAGGSKMGGADAYATSKQGNLATVFELARETPRLRFSAIEPGFTPGTSLGRDANPIVRGISKSLNLVAPLIRYWSTPKHSARVITEVLTGSSDATGVYFDENGKPMKGSEQVSDPEFDKRVVAETRELLATTSGR